jgi:hypothetical protein
LHPGVGGVTRGDVEHFGQHVEPDGPARRRDRARREHRVDASPAAQVDDDFARPQVGGPDGIPDTQRLLNGARGRAASCSGS